MRLSTHLLLFSVLGLFSEVSADPVPVVPKKAEILFPKTRSAPSDPITPVESLPANQLYVVVSPTKLMVLDSPQNLVTTTEVEVKDSFTLAGKFVDGNAALEFRTYEKGKWIYIIRPNDTDGNVELFFCAELDRSKAIRVSLSVNGGGTDPTPDPTSLFQKSLNAAYKLETADDKKLLPALIAFYDKAVISAGAVDTWVGLFTSMSKDADLLGTAGKLPNIQMILTTELKKVFPTGMLDPTMKMSASDKSNALATLKKFSDALKKVK